MSKLNRRTLLASSLGGSILVASSSQAQPRGRLFEAKPLPFNPAAVPGLSEKLIRSHYENNYVGAVTRLSSIQSELAKVDFATAPNFLINGLKREELIAWNSMILHEVHFEGFGDRGAPSAGLGAAIERDFGSHDRWAAEFAGMGKALGGGSGWVLLTWSARDRRLVNQWAADHTQTLADGAPLLALDMYEHAYHMDYGARAGAYVDAYMKAFSWNGANARFPGANV
jgi:superoxide dismutase, Fe-Mn family